MILRRDIPQQPPKKRRGKWVDRGHPEIGCGLVVQSIDSTWMTICSSARVSIWTGPPGAVKLDYFQFLHCIRLHVAQDLNWALLDSESMIGDRSSKWSKERVLTNVELKLLAIAVVRVSLIFLASLINTCIGWIFFSIVCFPSVWILVFWCWCMIYPSWTYVSSLSNRPQQPVEIMLQYQRCGMACRRWW